MEDMEEMKAVGEDGCEKCSGCQLWNKIIQDKRFPMIAYIFVLDVVETVGKLKRGNRIPPSDVTAEDIIHGVGVVASTRYGNLRLPVFQAWNVKEGRDIGVIMKDLCDVGMLKPSPGDRFERFDEMRVDFHREFSKEIPMSVLRPRLPW